ncbi:hypothetical protein CCB81_00515 [Armatimonadetes bacterium Uphvl-Ar2]|nr:hypothetical protein CCB81_00515 [Armatimonadetes bacterium Uphvl-Ar2]
MHWRAALQGGTQLGADVVQGMRGKIRPRRIPAKHDSPRRIQHQRPGAGAPRVDPEIPLVCHAKDLTRRRVTSREQMRRYGGEPLQAGERWAVVTNDALGNFVIATPLLQMFRAQHPGVRLDYYGGKRIQELSTASPLVDSSTPLLGMEPREFASALPAPYDGVINFEVSPWAKAVTALLAGAEGRVVGPCLGEEGRDELPFLDDEPGRLAQDKEWIHEDICQRFSILQTPHISEIFARMAYLSGPVPPYMLPSADPGTDVPDVLIATTASLASKIWPLEKWQALASALGAAGFRVGLLGAKPKVQGQYWKGASDECTLATHPNVQDLRGTLTMPQVVGAIQAARAVITLDNGIMHFACATSTPVIGLFRYGIHRLWAPPVPNLRVIHAGAEGNVADIPAEAVISEFRNFPGLSV